MLEVEVLPVSTHNIHVCFMENWRKLSQHYHQIPFLIKSSVLWENKKNIYLDKYLMSLWNCDNFFCSSNCLDFDLCESCESKAGMHNPDHVFVKIRRPCTGVGYQDGIRKPLLKNIIYRSHKRNSTKLLVPILGEQGENENELNFRLERWVPVVVVCFNAKHAG